MSTAIELPGLSETQRQIVELAREFARTKIEPFAAEWDRRAYFARDVIDELGRLGFLGMCAPEEYDGMGLDSVTYLLALEEIAAADASVAVSLSIHNAIPTTMLVRHGSPAQKDRWLKAMQFKLADMATRIEAARALAHAAATRRDRGEDTTMQASMAKLFASETAMWVTTQAVQLFGGYGYMRDFPVEKLFRDAKVTELYEGTSEIQRIVIARGLYPRGRGGASPRP